MKSSPSVPVSASTRCATTNGKVCCHCPCGRHLAIVATRLPISPACASCAVQGLGFTLEEIRELLALSGRREDDMGSLKAAATEKLADVEAKLAELSRIRDGLRMLVASCPGHGALEQCPILNALDEDRA